MSRQLRVEYPGAVYHVMARGNGKQVIYLDDRDRQLFLESLWAVCLRLDWQVWAYCLMPNHYHLLLQTAHPNLSLGMRDLNGNYAQAFNNRHERVGHLFQGRFKSKLVDKPGYLLELARYIMLNPVRSGLCARPDEWRWSSYQALLRGGSDPHLATGQLLAQFGPDQTVALPAFARFLSAGMASDEPVTTHRVLGVVGNDAFVAKAARHAAPPSPEVPRAERLRQSLQDYELESRTRDEAICMAYASGNYSQADIARHFRVHYSTVSRVVGNRSCRRTAIQDVTP
jgi:putative transposase